MGNPMHAAIAQDSLKACSSGSASSIRRISRRSLASSLSDSTNWPISVFHLPSNPTNSTTTTTNNNTNINNGTTNGIQGNQSDLAALSIPDPELRPPSVSAMTYSLFADTRGHVANRTAARSLYMGTNLPSFLASPDGNTNSSLSDDYTYSGYGGLTSDRTSFLNMRQPEFPDDSSDVQSQSQSPRVELSLQAPLAEPFGIQFTASSLASPTTTTALSSTATIPMINTSTALNADPHPTSVATYASAVAGLLPSNGQCVVWEHPRRQLLSIQSREVAAAAAAAAAAAVRQSQDSAAATARQQHALGDADLAVEQSIMDSFGHISESSSLTARAAGISFGGAGSSRTRPNNVTVDDLEQLIIRQLRPRAFNLLLSNSFGAPLRHLVSSNHSTGSSDSGNIGSDSDTTQPSSIEGVMERLRRQLRNSSTLQFQNGDDRTHRRRTVAVVHSSNDRSTSVDRSPRPNSGIGRGGNSSSVVPERPSMRSQGSTVMAVDSSAFHQPFPAAISPFTATSLLLDASENTTTGTTATATTATTTSTTRLDQAFPLDLPLTSALQSRSNRLPTARHLLVMPTLPVQPSIPTNSPSASHALSSVALASPLQNGPEVAELHHHAAELPRFTIPTEIPSVNVQRWTALQPTHHLQPTSATHNDTAFSVASATDSTMPTPAQLNRRVFMDVLRDGVSVYEPDSSLDWGSSLDIHSSTPLSSDGSNTSIRPFAEPLSGSDSAPGQTI
ncbi:hypothetical protein BASA62_002069 [Batrachochytrium salamandrivorans]|nr:hypothetical protein BASA62_002069 [Batrachochytrium salamandrivorans]